MSSVHAAALRQQRGAHLIWGVVHVLACLGRCEPVFFFSFPPSSISLPHKDFSLSSLDPDKRSFDPQNPVSSWDCPDAAESWCIVLPANSAFRVSQKGTTWVNNASKWERKCQHTHRVVGTSQSIEEWPDPIFSSGSSLVGLC